MRSGALTLVAAVLMLAGCSATQPVRQSVEFRVEDWKFGDALGKKILTEHYQIHTTLTDRALVDALPQFVEGCYEHYRTLVPPARDPNELMPVFLFATRSEWEAFTRKFTGARARQFLQVRNGGYSEQGVSVIEYVTHAVTFPLFAHEGFHQYLHHCVGRDIPAWLNEGLAVECEGQRWGVRLREFDPWYNPARRNVLAQALIANKLHPLRTLVRTHAGEIVGGSLQSIGSYYAQVWALVLFLREGENGKYAAKYKAMLADLSTGEAAEQIRIAATSTAGELPTPGEALFRHYIGDDLPAIELEYFKFMRARFVPR
jgi:hypothetical protein